MQVRGSLPTWKEACGQPGPLVTLTETVQEPAAGTVPPARPTWKPPEFAVAVPPQVLASPLGVATARLAGRLSVKATPNSASMLFGLVIVTVIVAMPFTAIDAGLNALAMLGGATAAAGPAVPAAMKMAPSQISGDAAQARLRSALAPTRGLCPMMPPPHREYRCGQTRMAIKKVG